MESSIVMPDSPLPTSLQHDFISSLSDRLNQIEVQWEALLSTDDKTTQMSNFVGAVHYLAGAAGVYGFISMSRRAYEIIGHLQPCIEKNVAFTQQTQYTIEQLVGSLGSLKEYYDDHGYFSEDHTLSVLSADSGSQLQKHTATQTPQQESSNEVYILEHNPDEEYALKVFLENAQHRVRIFKSLHRLQRAIEVQQPYAVIIDLQQSRQDATGQEFIANLKQGKYKIPVIALSDSGEFNARHQAIQMGASHFFTKPVDGYRLVDTLHRANNTHIVMPSRVLIVDDDPETSNYVAMHLKMEELNVEVLNDPTALLDTMASFHPDLILTDLYMPQCSGLELATIIRQHEVYSDIPIVFLTSENDDDTRLEALQLGSDDFFTKSMDVSIISKSIKSRLSRMASYAMVKKAMMWSPN